MWKDEPHEEDYRDHAHSWRITDQDTPVEGGHARASPTLEELKLREEILNCHQAILNFALYNGYGLDEAEDFRQDVLEKAYRKREQFRGDSQVKTWVLSIARNQRQDDLRKKRRRRCLNESDLPHQDQDGSVFDTNCDEVADLPETAIDNKSRDDVIRDSVAKLSKNHQLVIRIIALWPELEISKPKLAEELNLAGYRGKHGKHKKPEDGITPRGAGNLRERALQELKNLLKQEDII